MHGGTIMERIPIVIVSYNRKDMLEKCLDAIRENTIDIPYELVLVDNGSDIETANFIQKQEYNDDVYSVLRLPENQGFAKGYNAGLKKVSGRNFMIILNNDTEPAQRWLREIMLTRYNLLCLKENQINDIGMILPYTNFCCNEGIVVIDSGIKTKTILINGNVPAVCWGVTQHCYNAVCRIIEKLDGGYNFFHSDFEYGWAEDILTSEIISRLGFQKYAAGGSFIYHAGSATQNILKVKENYREKNMNKLGKYFEQLNSMDKKEFDII